MDVSQVQCTTPLPIICRMKIYVLIHSQLFHQHHVILHATMVRQDDPRLYTSEALISHLAKYFPL